MDPRHDTVFPTGFFSRADESDDAAFYAFDRFVTHLDDRAIATVGDLYDEVGLCGADSGPVLDLCSSWISHFPTKPSHLVVTGMNERELAANEHADARFVQDLNADPRLPLDDDTFAAVTCCVSVDYLVRPLDVFAEVARVLRPGGAFVCTFSNRCFPTKAIRGWLANDDVGHCRIVETYFEMTTGFGEPTTSHRNPGRAGDPVFAVMARTSTTQSD